MYIFNPFTGKLDYYSDDLTGTEIVTLLEALVGSAKLSHDSGLSDISPDDHHAQIHALDGGDHAVSGLTPGHFVKATGAGTFAFAAHGLTYSDVGAEQSGVSVLETDYGAQTILAAVTANTPAALTVDQQRIVGRITGGNIAGLTAAQVLTLIGVEPGATADQTEAEILALLGLTSVEVDQLGNIAATTISATQWGYLGGASTNGGALIDAADYAAMLALLSGEAGAAFDLNSQALTGIASLTLPNAGWIGIGAALERLEFYTAGYAAFMGCKVGFGTVTPAVTLDIGGHVILQQEGDARPAPAADTDPHLRVYSSDAGQANDYIEMYHDQIHGVIYAQYLEFKGTELFLKAATGVNACGIKLLDSNGNSMFRYIGKDDIDQLVFQTYDRSGNQIVIGSASAITYDYDHVAQVNPTIFIHSDTNPNDDNTQWISLTHNKTNGVFGLGSGAYIFPDGNFGIGTPGSPDQLLHIEGNDGTTYLKIHDKRSTTGDSVGIMLGTRPGAATSKSLIAHVETGGWGVGDIVFALRNTEDATEVSLSDEAIRIKSDGNIGFGTTLPDRLLHAEKLSALTNTVQQVARLTHITSGTPANNIGLGLEFEQETAADNNEVIATVEAIVTDVTPGSEDADLSFKLMAAGAAAAEKMRILGSGIIHMVSQSGFSAYLSANQDIGNGAITLVQFDSEEDDVRSEFNTGTYTFTAKSAGKYQVSTLLRYNENIQDGANVTSYIYKNGAMYARDTTTTGLLSPVSTGMSLRIPLAASDTIDIRTYHSHTEARQLLGSECRFSVAKVA